MLGSGTQLGWLRLKSAKCLFFADSVTDETDVWKTLKNICQGSLTGHSSWRMQTQVCPCLGVFAHLFCGIKSYHSDQVNNKEFQPWGREGWIFASTRERDRSREQILPISDQKKGTNYHWRKDRHFHIFIDWVRTGEGTKEDSQKRLKEDVEISKLNYEGTEGPSWSRC